MRADLNANPLLPQEIPTSLRAVPLLPLAHLRYRFRLGMQFSLLWKVQAVSSRLPPLQEASPTALPFPPQKDPPPAALRERRRYLRLPRHAARYPQGRSPERFLQQQYLRSLLQG